MESVIFGDNYLDFDHNLPVIFKNALLQNLLKFIDSHCPGRQNSSSFLIYRFHVHKFWYASDT